MQNFIVLLLAYTLSQFFRAFLAVIAPELARELGLTAADLGNVSAVWFLAFALSQFPIGFALDRVGPRRTVSVLMLAAAAGAFVFSRAQGVAACLAGMALIGVGCAPVYMGALYLFGRCYPAVRFAMLSSWLLAIGAIGNLLGATPLAWAVHAVGWRPTFAGIAVLTMASAGLVAWLVADPPPAKAMTRSQSFLGGLAEILAIRALWPLLPLTLAGYAIVAGERGLWLGPYLADVHGLDPTQRGNIVLVMAIAMSLGALAYGPLDGWLERRKALVAFGNTAAALAFIALGSMPAANLLTVTVLIAVIGGIGMTYALLMAHARPLFPEHLLGRGITCMNFLFLGGAGLLQPLSGAYVARLSNAGLQPASVYAALHLAFGLTLLATVAIYLFSQDRR